MSIAKLSWTVTTPGMERHPASSTCLLDAAAAAAAADADQETQLRHMREIAEVRRMQGGVTPELLQQALQQSRLRRARRLFQPLPYLQQEQADVTSTDVAAIVEILCGKPSPATPSAITGTVGLEDPAVYWQQRPAQILQGGSTQQQQQQVLHSDSIGQIASCVLVKLIVDLWLSAGGAVAFPLVLRMLQQALYQQQPEHRVNAFNIVYNLALHGCMLMSAQRSHPSSPVAQPVRRDAAAAAATAAAQAGSSSLLQQQLQQLSLLQHQHREQQHPTAAEIAVGQQDPETDSPGAAASDLNPGHHQGQGSPRSQGGSSAHSYSPLSSPRIHLPTQLLSPTSQQQQQQQQGFISLTQQQQQQQQFGGSTSPLPSPTGRSRLSRSELRIHAEQLRRSNEQQEHQPSPAAAAAASDDGAAEGDDGEGGSEGQSGSGSSSSSEGLPPVELAWEAWLQQLLYELLLMLSMVSMVAAS
jgi:hypothetical protein